MITQTAASWLTSEYMGPAIWRNRDHDEPVTITRYAGERDGIDYYHIEGSSTGIPETELYPVEDASEEITFQIAISTKNRKQKITQGSSQWSKFNDSFKNLDLTVEQLIDHIGRGHSYTSPHWHERHTLASV